MSITLVYSGTTLTLPEDYFWQDENAWHPVEQTAQRTITGSVVISASQRVGGRPITLQPLDDGTAWMPYSMLATLKTWGAVAGRQMTLTIRGAVRTVIFRHQDGSAIEATPIVHYSDVVSGDFYLVTLKFQEV
jgi:hypothetical protein